MKPWIIITITGTTAGAVVGALTYTATVNSTDILATGTNLGINAIGTVGSYVASAFLGDMAGMSVRIASRVAGKLTEETVKSGGRTAAAIMAATTGALTTLTFTAGSHIIKYSIEYGGKITQELAKQIAEDYLRYKTNQTGFVNDKTDTGWVIVETDEDNITSTHDTSEIFNSSSEIVNESSEILNESSKSVLSTVSDVQESV
jgi:hypothetical protein